MRPVEERPDPLERGAIADDHECEIEVWTDAAKRARISYFARLPVRVPFTRISSAAARSAPSATMESELRSRIRATIESSAVS